MPELSANGKKILKGVHLFFVCAWLGAAVSLLLLGYAKNGITNGDELYAFNASMKLIDDFIIIPSAFGTLITGLMFSVFTKWGFFKFYWIIVKYAAIIAQILFGSFFLGPWLNGATAIVDAERIEALQNQTYLYFSQMNTYFGLLQALLLVVIVFISVFKPWGKRG